MVHSSATSRHSEEQALLAACRVLVGISAQSIAAVEDVANVLQVRALVVIASRGPVSLGELAEAMNIHLTRASRLCDRLVLKGLINRTDDPDNRRQLTLTLTPSGRRLVDTVTAHRRRAIGPILARMTKQMPEQRRSEFVSILQEFVAAAGEPSHADLWALGWTP
jgi:DNA-binding MarR family transcriptional regulator